MLFRCASPSSVSAHVPRKLSVAHLCGRLPDRVPPTNPGGPVGRGVRRGDLEYCGPLETPAFAINTALSSEYPSKTGQFVQHWYYPAQTYSCREVAVVLERLGPGAAKPPITRPWAPS